MNKSEKKKYRQYVGIETGLQEANCKYISVNKQEASRTVVMVNKLTEKILQAMKDYSPAFKSMCIKKFGAGSAFEGTKVGTPQEFDIDILLRLPGRPVILEFRNSRALAHVMIKLEDFPILRQRRPDIYNEFGRFGVVDDQSFLRTDRFKSFFESILISTINQFDSIEHMSKQFKILKVQNLGPAFTLTLEELNFHVKVDLVPCILLDQSQWPQLNFRSNPFPNIKNRFFLVPKKPKNDIPNVERYWRLSFQIQEKKSILNKHYLKPALKVLKAIRDHFRHDISSYALKTMFLWELDVDKDDKLAHMRPQVVWTCPFSYCVVHMLERYEQCLKQGRINYYWNEKFNLIDINEEERSKYVINIQGMLQDIIRNPCKETILKYLHDTKLLNQL